MKSNKYKRFIKAAKNGYLKEGLLYEIIAYSKCIYCGGESLQKALGIKIKGLEQAKSIMTELIPFCKGKDMEKDMEGSRSERLLQEILYDMFGLKENETENNSKKRGLIKKLYICNMILKSKIQKVFVSNKCKEFVKAAKKGYISEGYLSDVWNVSFSTCVYGQALFEELGIRIKGLAEADYLAGELIPFGFKGMKNSASVVEKGGK